MRCAPSGFAIAKSVLHHHASRVVHPFFNHALVTLFRMSSLLEQPRFVFLTSCTFLLSPSSTLLCRFRFKLSHPVSFCVITFPRPLMACCVSSASQSDTPMPAPAYSAQGSSLCFDRLVFCPSRPVCTTSFLPRRISPCPVHSHNKSSRPTSHSTDRKVFRATPDPSATLALRGSSRSSHTFLSLRGPWERCACQAEVCLRRVRTVYVCVVLRWVAKRGVRDEVEVRLGRRGTAVVAVTYGRPIEGGAMTAHGSEKGISRDMVC